MNDKPGRKTPFALVVESATIGLSLMYRTGLLYDLPNVVLAAIVLVPVQGLINIGQLRHVWRVSRFALGVSIVAFAGVLLLGILNGVIVAIVASMLLLIRRAAHPHAAVLSRIPGTSRSYSDRGRNPDNEALPGALIFRVEVSLVGAGVKPASTSRHKSGASNAVTAACNFGLRAQREGRPARGQRRSVQGLTEDGF